MSDNFETPYDGKHHANDETGRDWRPWYERIASYGNFAGPGNRNDAAHGNDGGTYKPIDGMDAAAERHDKGYEALHGRSMWGWDGISSVAKADRSLADETDHEMATNGGQYSGEAQNYSKAMRGIFGGRASVVEGVNWAGNKAHEAKDGIGNFIDSAKDWHSAGDAGRGIANGVTSGAKWLGNTASQAWNGVKDTASYFHKLGPLGMAGAAFGGGEALLAGGVHLAGQAGRGIANGVSSAARAVGGAASSVGGAISNGVHSAGNAVASGASAAWNGAKSVGSSVASGAKAAGSAIAGGVSKAWNWLRH
jgi:hypothetical protein